MEGETTQTGIEEKTIEADAKNDSENSENDPKVTQEEPLETIAKETEDNIEEAQKETTNGEENLDSNNEIKLGEKVDQIDETNGPLNIEIINEEENQTTQENGVLEQVDAQIEFADNNAEPRNTTTEDIDNLEDDAVNILETGAEQQNEETQGELQVVETPTIPTETAPTTLQINNNAEPPNETTEDIGNPEDDPVNISETPAEQQHEEPQGELQVVDTPTIAPETAPTSLQITLLHPNVKNTIEQYIAGFGITDYTLAVSSASDIGDNFSGLIGKIEINGVQNGTPVSHNYIVKTAPHLEMYRTFLNIEKFYAREVFTYAELFPLFKTLQATTNILEPFDNYPEYILSSLAPMEETVVMQDMKSIGYVLGDRQKTLDLDHVKLVMKTYGKLHAMSFALKTLNRDGWQWVKTNAKNALMEGFKKDAVYQMQRPFMDKILGTLDEKTDAKYLLKFKKFSDNFIDVYLDRVQKSSDCEVILHGDCWVNNMLWKYSDGKPEKVCLIDWQQSNCGSPASDLTYFLFTSTSKEFRDQYYDAMLRLYYYSLCEHLNEFGVNPEVCLTYEELQKQMKTFGVIGLYYSLILLGIVTKDKEEIPEWRDDSVDIAEFSAKFLTSSQKSEEDFKVRVRGVIIDYYEKGYLDCLQ